MEIPVNYNDIQFKMYVPDLNSLKEYPGANVQEYLIKNKVWAEDETMVALKILNKEKGLFIDIGANTGYFSFLALVKGCQVIAVEPNTIHTPYFMKTLNINNFPLNKIKHYELFVSSSKNNIMFDGWSACEGIVNKESAIETKTIAVTDLCTECLFLKIDVEGFEPDVLNSAKPLLEQAKIPYIMFEITYIIYNKIDITQINMLKMLESYGYYIYIINPGQLDKISDIDKQVNKWEYEYLNCHKVHNPMLTLAGANLFACHKNKEVPFIKIGNSDNYYLN
jgi:FkbM family methyltransferase